MKYVKRIRESGAGGEAHLTVNQASPDCKCSNHFSPTIS